MDPIVSIFKKKDLLWQFLIRNVKQRHRGSMLGAFWLIANPLLMLCLYVFAFGIVFGGRFTDSPNESTLDYALGVFLGLSTIGLVSGTIGVSPGIIVSQPNFVKKVVFPLEILPTAIIGALSYDLLIGLALCLTGICFLGSGFSSSFIYIPIIIGPIFLISLGVSWFFSALGVFIRDFSQLGPFLSLALLYSSGVFYSATKAEKTAPHIWKFLQWNPILQIIDNLRSVTIWNSEINWQSVVFTWIVGIIFLIFGSLFFHRLRPTFADVV